MTDREIDPIIGISLLPYTKVSGYSHLSVFVRFTQDVFVGLSTVVNAGVAGSRALHAGGNRKRRTGDDQAASAVLLPSLSPRADGGEKEPTNWRIDSSRE